MMTVKQLLLDAMAFTTKVMTDFVADLTDAELLVRPVDGANHIAWQLGHLITAEHRLMRGIGASMPDLPDGFAHRHNKAAAASDDAANFATKDEYLRLYAEQRAASRAALEGHDEAKFADPLPERGFPPHLKRFVDVFLLLSMHQCLHSGQFTATRRKLGKAVVF